MERPGWFKKRHIAWAAILGVAAWVYFRSPPNPPTPYGHFVGKVVTEWIDVDGREMKVLEDFAYVDPWGKVWLAPKDSVVDGASIPKAFWNITGGPFEGRYRNASVVHDVACDQKKERWQDVHRMFYWACVCGGVPESSAKVLYWAVYNHGPRWPDPTTAAAPPPKPAMPPKAERAVVTAEAAQYIKQNNPPIEAIPALSREGAPLDPN